MTISYNEIPKNQRVPLVWCEIDPSRATRNAAAMPYAVLILGHSLTSADGVPQRVTSAAQAARLFGAGSLLAAQAKAWFKANTTTETYFLPVAEPQGAAAGLTLTFGGEAASGGTIYLYIGTQRLSAYVAPGATAREAAEALAAAIALDGAFTAEAAADSPALTVKAPHKGTYANGLMIRLGYYQGEDLPEGLSVSFGGSQGAPGSPTPDYEISAALAGVVAFHGENDPARPFQSLTIPGMLPPRKGTFGRMTGGGGVPDLLPVFADLGDTHYHLMVTPWTDDATLAVFKDLAKDRWHALTEKPTQVICAAHGGHSALGALGHRHNSPHLTVLGTGGPFTAQENNLLLSDGISTYMANADGGCNIQRLITTYKENAWGAEDTAYLDLNTPLTLTYLRRSYKVWMSRVFPRHKLCSDDTNFGFGQAMATPNMIKGETLAWFDAMERLGLVENLNQFKKDLIVERNKDDSCRVDVYLPPDIVNQLRVLAVQLGFRL